MRRFRSGKIEPEERTLTMTRSLPIFSFSKQEEFVVERNEWFTTSLPGHPKKFLFVNESEKALTILGIRSIYLFNTEQIRN